MAILYYAILSYAHQSLQNQRFCYGHVEHSTGSGNVEFESPILRSAVQDKPAFVCPVCFNPTPLTEVVTLSRFFFAPGESTLKRKEEKDQKFAANVQ